MPSVLGPNGANATTTYDGYGRPLQSTIPDGAATNYAYTYNPNTQTASLTDTQGTRWTKTTLDGFGRVTSVVKGHDSTPVSEVDTQYAPCACSPLGKVWKVSQPYAPNATVYWTTYTYDASGRPVTVTAPDGNSVTRYSYAGNTTLVWDASNKWKNSTSDVFGNLKSVLEPDTPHGYNNSTTYTYNGANQVIQVTMQTASGTQTRTFTWIGTDLASATNPENGTVSYTYDLAHHVLARTDAKNQQTQYTYDGYGRLTEVRHYYLVSNQLQEDTSQRWDYYYDTDPLDPNFPAQNTWGRLTAVSFYSNNIGALSYQYSYNQAGRVTLQRLQAPVLLPAPNPFNFDATYAWDNEGRMTSLGYPGNGPGFYGPVYAYAFDAMGRLTTMQENGVRVATAGYDWANHATSMTYDNFNESRTYDPQMMQLTHLTTKNGSPTVMDMTYGYTAGQNNGRITQSIDAVLNETVNYTYDSLNHLATAQATNNSWGNAYSYDGFGNLTGATVTAGSAPYFGISIDPATNRIAGGQYDANGNPITNESQYDVENRLMTEATNGWYTVLGYDPSGKRVTQIDVVNSVTQNQRIYFYAITGQRLGTYTVSPDGTTFLQSSLNLYFGGKLVRSAGATVATDRLGSVRANSAGERMAYWPYGGERPGTNGATTPDGREKFGTYFRDSYTNLDYADQRYYNFTWGRFQTPDPGGSVLLTDPHSWNKYMYARGDPANRRDPRGLMDCLTCGDEGGGGEWWCDGPGDPFCFGDPGSGLGGDGGGGGGGGVNASPFIPAVVWRTNPGAAVTAWDLAIAAVVKLAAQQGYALYPAYLDVNTECVSTNATGSLELERNYILKDQYGGSLGGTFQEYIAVVSGSHASGPTDLYQANDWDFISANFNKQYNFYQTFVATSLGFGPVPVYVKDNGVDYGTLAVETSKTQIIINGVDLSGIRRCGPGDPKP